MQKYKLYVGNLDYKVTSKDLITIFSEYGEVAEAMVIPSKEEGKSKGFGFVTFHESEEAQHAINNLDGKDYFGRSLVVKPAQEKGNGEQN